VATRITVVTLMGGERRVELTTTLDNTVSDHRLRAWVHLPFAPERLDVEHGLAVVRRPLDPGAALGHGAERAAPTGQHHGFVDAADAVAGVAIMSPGLPEHELVRGSDGAALALTLVRGVGWLSRGDLSVIGHAAGPIVPTPGAQELGAHRFTYALLLHAGDWEQAGLPGEARRFAAPPIAFPAHGAKGAPLAGVALVRVEPPAVTITALTPAEGGGGLIVRVVNLSPCACSARLSPGWPAREAVVVDPLGQSIAPQLHRGPGDAFELPLRPWQIATVRISSEPERAHT
jgi:alpha-mannosidase